MGPCFSSYGQPHREGLVTSMASRRPLSQHESHEVAEGNHMFDGDGGKSPSPGQERAVDGEAGSLSSNPPANGGVRVVFRPLRHGDVRTIKRLFDGLSERSRRHRFNGPKPCLSRSDLKQLATVNSAHQAVVAYVEDRPVAIARLVRNGSSSEIAFAVVDEYQRHGIGSALVSDLLDRARTGGITEVTALVSSSNPDALALIRRLTRLLSIQYEGSDLSVRAAIP